MIAGIAGTAVMTLVASMAPMMGLPKMSPPEMIASMTGLPIAAGWVMHFLIGIMFAAGFGFVFFNKVDTASKKVTFGLLFGLLAFVIGQIGMMAMAMLFNAPPMGDMIPMMMGSAMGHLIFGVTVSFVYGTNSEISYEQVLAS